MSHNVSFFVWSQWATLSTVSSLLLWCSLDSSLQPLAAVACCQVSLPLLWSLATGMQLRWLRSGSQLDQMRYIHIFIQRFKLFPCYSCSGGIRIPGWDHQTLCLLVVILCCVLGFFVDTSCWDDFHRQVYCKDSHRLFFCM